MAAPNHPGELAGKVALVTGASRNIGRSIALALALAKELGEYRINVNCVAPGQMNTTRAADRSARPDVSNVPMGRRVEPEEIASTIRFLCSPGAAMISGQLIYVDGGQQQF